MSDDRTQPTTGDPARGSDREATTTGSGTGTSSTGSGSSRDTADSTRQTPAVSPQARREPETVVETPDRATIVARQKAAFGGVKPFVAFFGWLTATGDRKSVG